MKRTYQIYELRNCSVLRNVEFDGSNKSQNAGMGQ